MTLAEHFTLAELVASEYATRHEIDNTPDTEALANLHALAEGLERARVILGEPMIVSSGYRSPKVNSAVGGSRTSYHQRGLAADFRCAGQSPAEICKRLLFAKDIVLYDKLILEYPRSGGWTHIQFPDGEASPRQHEYTIFSRATGYQPGILEA